MKEELKTAVVFVHGLFLNGAEFTLLRRRLAVEHGFRNHRFSYPTVRGSMNGAVAQLARFVERIEADRIHFVGHSLGGLVLCRYFQTTVDSRAGRVVLLGSPVGGSRSARAVAKHSFLRRVIGPLVAEELLDSNAPRSWDCDCELGLVAGSQPMGLGRFFARFDEACDGTVGVSETHIPGERAHLTVHTSHMGLLVSPVVAKKVGRFLLEGRFD